MDPDPVAEDVADPDVERAAVSEAVRGPEDLVDPLLVAKEGRRRDGELPITLPGKAESERARDGHAIKLIQKARLGPLAVVWINCSSRGSVIDGSRKGLRVS